MKEFYFKAEDGSMIRVILSFLFELRAASKAVVMAAAKNIPDTPNLPLYLRFLGVLWLG